MDNIYFTNISPSDSGDIDPEDMALLEHFFVTGEALAPCQWVNRSDIEALYED